MVLKSPSGGYIPDIGHSYLHDSHHSIELSSVDIRISARVGTRLSRDPVHTWNFFHVTTVMSSHTAGKQRPVYSNGSAIFVSIEFLMLCTDLACIYSKI